MRTSPGLVNVSGGRCTTNINGHDGIDFKPPSVRYHYIRDRRTCLLDCRASQPVNHSDKNVETEVNWLEAARLSYASSTRNRRDSVMLLRHLLIRPDPLAPVINNGRLAICPKKYSKYSHAHSFQIVSDRVYYRDHGDLPLSFNYWHNAVDAPNELFTSLSTTTAEDTAKTIVQRHLHLSVRPV